MSSGIQEQTDIYCMLHSIKLNSHKKQLYYELTIRKCYDLPPGKGVHTAIFSSISLLRWILYALQIKMKDSFAEMFWKNGK